MAVPRALTDTVLEKPHTERGIIEWTTSRYQVLGAEYCLPQMISRLLCKRW